MEHIPQKPVQGNSTETTSISLPPAQTGPQELDLSSQDAAAIAALPKANALLIAHTGAHQGARFLLDSDTILVGRHPEAGIVLDDVTVSRRHVNLQRTETGFAVQDLGSLNGTYVNHDRVDQHVLRPGDELQIGKFRLTYYAGAK